MDAQQRDTEVTSSKEEMDHTAEKANRGGAVLYKIDRMSHGAKRKSSPRRREEEKLLLEDCSLSAPRSDAADCR